MTTETIAALAAASIDRADTGLWPILADALEEAGADESLVRHFRTSQWTWQEVYLFRLAGRPTPQEAWNAKRQAMTAALAAAETRAIEEHYALVRPIVDRLESAAAEAYAARQVSDGYRLRRLVQELPLRD